jgi:hypothetical protein
LAGSATRLVSGFHNPLGDRLFLSAPARMLVRMTKSRSSSPYPDPPTGLVRALVRDGWRRAEAEAVQVVWEALRHAADPDASTWATRAAAALTKEPVRLAFVHRLADEDTSTAIRQLYRASSPEHRPALSAFWTAVERKTELEGLEYMRDHLKELRNFPAFDGVFG